MYCAVVDLTERFGENEILDFAGNDHGEIDVDRVETAIKDASDEIDLYIGKVTTLPIPAVPPSLLRICADIARYRLQGRRPMEEVTQRYKDAMKVLSDIANGKADLGLPDPTSNTSGGSVYADKGEDDRIFTSGTLRDFL